jgi:hypothetical protein
MSEIQLRVRASLVVIKKGLELLGDILNLY